MTTAIEPVQEIALQEDTGYQLVALDRPQMESGHAKMIEWAHIQLATVQAEKKGEEEALAVAVERKWATAAFRRRIVRLEQRVSFYQKIEGALRAGYVIVPNFEMTVFAIRTKAKSPRGTRTDRTWRNNFIQEPQLLPAGEGEYQNPAPTVYQHDEKSVDDKGKEKTTRFFYPAKEFDDIEFPIALAKPALMTKTAEAMARKVFDEVGVAVDRGNQTGSRGDPIVLGRLRNPRTGRASMTFFLGWYFDPTRI